MHQHPRGRGFLRPLPIDALRRDGSRGPTVREDRQQAAHAASGASPVARVRTSRRRRYSEDVGRCGGIPVVKAESASMGRESAGLRFPNQRRVMRVVPPRGIEPPTRGLGNRCSIHLSYGGTKAEPRERRWLASRVRLPSAWWRGAFHGAQAPNVGGSAARRTLGTSKGEQPSTGLPEQGSVHETWKRYVPTSSSRSGASQMAAH